MLTPASHVKDLMQTDLVTVGPSDSLKEAMSLLIDGHVSGLPVVDGAGRCLGVISTTDILGLEYEQASATQDYEEVGSYFDPDKQRWENLRFAGGVDDLPDLAVEDVMTAEVVSVPLSATVKSVAELMVERRVHRILVIDQNQKLRGLIAALDLVQLIADSAAE